MTNHKYPPQEIPHINEWLNFLSAKELSYGTIHQYCFHYRLFFLEHQQVLTQENVNAYITEHKGKVARGFIRNYLEFNHNREIVIPKRTGTLKTRVKPVLSQYDIELLKFAMYEVKEVYGIMFELEYMGGLRREELINLTINSFDWQKWISDKSKPCRMLVRGKGDKERIVPIPSHLAKRISDYYREKLHQGLLRFDSKMFSMGKHRWWKILRDVGRVVLEKDIHPHMLRRTKATDLWASGNFDLIDIKNFLGHSDISTTQIYIQPDVEKSLRKLEENLVLVE